MRDAVSGGRALVGLIGVVSDLGLSCSIRIEREAPDRVVGRAVEQIPLDSLVQLRLSPLLDLEIPVAPGATSLVGRIVELPLDLRSADELKCPISVEVEKEKPCTRVCCEVAQGVEHAVAYIIRDADRSVIEHADEAWVAASVGGVDTARRMSARHKEGVGAADEVSVIVFKALTSSRRAETVGVVDSVGDEVPALDVLGAVGVGLFDVEAKSSWTGACDAAVDA